MSYLQWSDELATGIGVIDSQHKRIIHYINQLEDARALNEPDLVKEVLINLTDYTLSHFAFEESLMEDAGYEAAAIHSKTHDSFRDRIRSYNDRFSTGEDVSEELSKLLNVWLIEHIANDDSSYTSCVLKNIPGINNKQKSGWLSRKLHNFFA
ncbi:MAG: bacteriohemerythrin [Thiotrichales bacterium]|nr:MAG: bacteriohemerythrin [Thiotrichales bacterium]